MNFLDKMQGGLTVAQFIPGLNTVAGLANAAIDVYKGDYGSALLNVLGAIPVAGVAIKAIAVTAKVGTVIYKAKAIKAAIVLGKAGNKRVFWSGGKAAEEAALEFAKRHGLNTLEMSEEALQLVEKTKNMPWSEALPMWERLSASFAQNARGVVHFFKNEKNFNPSGIWNRIEKPILQGKNKIISHKLK